MKLMKAKPIFEEISSSLLESINQLKDKDKLLPKLVVIQVGDNLSSNIYVRNKQKSCEKIGMLFEIKKFKESTTEKEIITEIKKLNNDISVTGMIIQLPLPKHINDKNLLNYISPKKDADGFTPEVLGNVMIGKSDIYPSTPLGITKLLEYYKVPIIGSTVVIIGRSNIVGKPLANMLINLGATVTVCNTKTKNIKKVTKQADILVSAAGVARLIDKTYIKKNAVIVDVGANFVDGVYCGDVDIKKIGKKVSLLSPVPGGVGPMTIVSLMLNTMALYNQK